MPLFARVDEETENRFRQKVYEIYGYRKGAIEKALEEALLIWLASVSAEAYSSEALAAIFEKPYAQLLECLKEFGTPATVSEIAERCKEKKENAEKYIRLLESARFVARDGDSCRWTVNQEKTLEADNFLKTSKEFEPIAYSAPRRGYFRIPEESSTKLMTRLATWTVEEMIATSYYDIENWTTSNTAERGFWTEYIEAQKLFIDTIRDRVRRENPDITENQLKETLEKHPPVRRVFIFDSATMTADQNTGDMIEALKRHNDINGYEVRCIMKDKMEEVQSIKTAIQSTRIHDFVMFDKRIVVEMVREPSAWGRNSKNTYGITYVDSSSGDSPKWTAIFDGYFTNLWEKAIPCGKWLEEAKPYARIKHK